MYGSRASRWARVDSSQVRSTHGENRTAAGRAGQAGAADLGGQRGGQVPARRVARDHDAGRGHAAVQQPAVRGEGVLQRRREGVLGGQPVVGRQDRQAGVERQPGRDGPVRAGRAHHVPAAVQVQDGAGRGPPVVGVAADHPFADDAGPSGRARLDLRVVQRADGHPGRVPHQQRRGVDRRAGGAEAGRVARHTVEERPYAVPEGAGDGTAADAGAAFVGRERCGGGPGHRAGGGERCHLRGRPGEGSRVHLHPVCRVSVVLRRCPQSGDRSRHNLVAVRPNGLRCDSGHAAPPCGGAIA